MSRVPASYVGNQSAVDGRPILQAAVGARRVRRWSFGVRGLSDHPESMALAGYRPAAND